MARENAYMILNQYFEDESFLNIALNEQLKKSNLKREDKDLCTTIVYGTIQNLLYIQYQLQPYIKGKRVKKKIRTLLYMSLYQLIYLDKIPEYAIINEAVKIAKKEGYQTSQFVNAVLRNFTRNERRSLEELDELEKISIMTSHPLWMVKMFNKQYGLEKTKMICEEDNMPPTRSGRVNTLKTTKEELLKESCFEEGTLSQDALLYKRGNLAYTSYYKEGKVTIQDESSQLVARLLDPQKTDYVLDMCSAPGSKTTHLAALMENQGKIEAYDLYKHKVKLIEHNLRLVAHIVKKYDHSKEETDDLISIGTIGLIKGIDSFSYKHGTRITTYCARCIENEILMYLRKNNKIRYEISLDEPLNIDYDGNELLLGDIVGTDDDLVEQEMLKSDQKKIFYEALKELNEREKEILILRYGLSNNDELTQKDVADLLGISQSYISRLEKKIIKKLRSQLNYDEVK